MFWSKLVTISSVGKKISDTAGMCSLISPSVDPRSISGSGSALLMSEKSQTVHYISSCHVLIDKALSSD